MKNKKNKKTKKLTKYMKTVSSILYFELTPLTRDAACSKLWRDGQLTIMTIKNCHWKTLLSKTKIMQANSQSREKSSSNSLVITNVEIAW